MPEDKDAKKEEVSADGIKLRHLTPEEVKKELREGLPGLKKALGRLEEARRVRRETLDIVVGCPRLRNLTPEQLEAELQEEITRRKNLEAEPKEGLWNTLKILVDT